jgi:hypothetical protein
MKNCWGALLTLFLLMMLVHGGAAAAAFERVIPPGQFEEHCVKLEPNATLTYRFVASGAVEFNIHHHRGKDVLYPVKRDRIRKLEGRFRARASDDYCLMWENKGKQTVTLRGTVEP